MKSIYHELAQELKNRAGRIHLSTVQFNGESDFSFTAAGDSKNNPKINFPAEKIISSDAVTSYSGADTVISIDGEVCSEIQEIYYQKLEPQFADLIFNNGDYIDSSLVKEYPIILVVVYSVFDKDPVRHPQNERGMDFHLHYQTESGQRSEEAINGAKVLYEYGGSSIDTLVQERTVVMMAREHIPMRKL